MPCHSYIFFDISSSIHTLSDATLRGAKTACVKLCNVQTKVQIEAFGTLGFKAGTRFMLHVRAENAAHIQEFVRDFVHSKLGKHLKVSYTLFGMRRPSPYNPKQTLPEEHEMNGRYLIVYPFVKTIEWHLIPHEKRASIMKDHVVVGRKFTSTISQLLLYSYGLDDQEFIVSYATDSLQDFQTLVMELRNTEARRHTERDTPIYLCTRLTLADAFNLI